MKAKAIVRIAGMFILLAGSFFLFGCGQAGSGTAGQTGPQTLTINQEVKIIGYDNVSVPSAETLSLAASPTTIEFAIISNYPDKITGAQVSVNYAAFNSVALENGGKVVIDSLNLSVGQNPISVKTTYSSGQEEINYLKIIISGF